VNVEFCLLRLFSVSSVLRDFAVCESHVKSNAFNTENTEGRREIRSETENAKNNHMALIYLCHPGDRRRGLRAAAGGLIGNGQGRNFGSRHIHRSHERNLAGSVGMENGDAHRLSCFRNEPKL
jgi:hypothetical protein